MELLQTILIMVFSITLLVGVHEFGHYWVARRCGVTVLRFSIGFGPALLRWQRGDTDFQLAAIPLGGYIKMLDGREFRLYPKERPFAFDHKPVLARMAIVLAGPAANLLLAVLAFWCVFALGERAVAPVVGAVAPDSIAARAGVEPGHEIVAVDGADTPTWQAVYLRMLKRMGDTGVMELSLRPRSLQPSLQPQDVATARTVGLPLQGWLADGGDGMLLESLGIERWWPPTLPVVERAAPDSPAARAGLQPGDQVTHADGIAMPLWQDLVAHVQARPGEAVELQVRRDGQTRLATIVPEARADRQGGSYGWIGMNPRAPEWPEGMQREYRRGPLAALGAALGRTLDLSLFTLDAVKKMLTGLLTTDNLSGPVTIAKVAADSAQIGLVAYITFLALLSISLGVLNLLPIPMLDGGQMLYFTIELLARRPLPEKVQMVGNQVGIFIILGIMVLAISNDVAGLVP